MVSQHSAKVTLQTSDPGPGQSVSVRSSATMDSGSAYHFAVVEARSCPLAIPPWRTPLFVCFSTVDAAVDATVVWTSCIVRLCCGGRFSPVVVANAAFRTGTLDVQLCRLSSGDGLLDERLGGHRALGAGREGARAQGHESAPTH